MLYLQHLGRPLEGCRGLYQRYDSTSLTLDCGRGLLSRLSIAASCAAVSADRLSQALLIRREGRSQP